MYDDSRFIEKKKQYFMVKGRSTRQKRVNKGTPMTLKRRDKMHHVYMDGN